MATAVGVGAVSHHRMWQHCSNLGRQRESGGRVRVLQAGEVSYFVDDVPAVVHALEPVAPDIRPRRNLDGALIDVGEHVYRVVPARGLSPREELSPWCARDADAVLHPVVPRDEHGLVEGHSPGLGFSS